MDERDRPLAAAFGQTLLAARARSGLSMQQLSRRCGVSRSTISQLENGGACATLATLYALARGLGVEPADLLPAADSAGDSPAADRNRLPRRPQ